MVPVCIFVYTAAKILREFFVLLFVVKGLLTCKQVCKNNKLMPYFLQKFSLI